MTTYDFYAEPDGSFFRAQGSSNQNMFHMDSRDFLIWTKLVDPSVGYVVAIKKINEGFLGFGNANYNAVGVGYFGYYYLLKSTLNGELTGCPAYPDQLVLRNLPFTMLDDLMAAMDSTNIRTEKITVKEASGKFDMSEACNKVSTCNSIKIIGSDVHCSNGPAIFKGRRNSECNLPVSFSASPAAGVTIQSIADTTSSIGFSTDGTYLIRSILHTGCGEFYDSMVVKVQKAAPLELGPDTILCNNSHFAIKAQGGYKAYLWNNGSTDSVMTINTTGTYHVAVKDFCNNVFYDFHPG